MSDRLIRVATDVGGTFTDLVSCEIDQDTGVASAVRSHKANSTPPDFQQGVMNVLKRSKLDPKNIGFFAHGTTMAINALLGRSGAPTGLITTQGFRDVLEIGRGNRPDLFNFHYSKPKPFVPRHLRFEVEERTSHLGDIIEPIDLQQLAMVLDQLKSHNVNSVAVCFLHSYANPQNELLAVDYISKECPEMACIASHMISREWREYERTSTTVLSAYVHPVAARYLENLSNAMADVGCARNMYVMKSNGGIDTFKSATQAPINLLESGPAGGVFGAVELGKKLSIGNIISLDVGGTTAKCALSMGGEIQVTTDYRVEATPTYPGYPVSVPTVDLVEIGSGGGSICWIDDNGKLSVGPRSAGADPGPVAYGLGGTQPTVSDAHLITRRMNSKLFFGGEIAPDLDAVEDAFGVLAGELGVTVDEVACGVIRMADSNMANALRLVSVNRGHDPREFTLVVFGGGGGLHAISVSNELGINKVLLPMNPDVFSAWGMLLTDLRRDYIRTRLIPVSTEGAHHVRQQFDGMKKEAVAEFAEDGIPGAQLTWSQYVDARYRGQEHTVKIEVTADQIDELAVEQIVNDFHAEHDRKFTFTLENPVEIVNSHLIVYSPVPKPQLSELSSSVNSLNDAFCENRNVNFDMHGWLNVPVYDRSLLGPGIEIQGPAIIQEPSSTFVLWPRWEVEIDKFGILHAHRVERHKDSIDP